MASRHLATVLVVIGMFWGGAAQAQSVADPPPEKPLPHVVPGAVYRAEDFFAPTGFQQGAEKQSPFQEEPQKAPTPDKVQDSSRETPPDPLSVVEPRDGSGCGVASCDPTPACDTACTPSCDKTCQQACDPSCRKIFGLTFGAWLDQGITANGRGSPDRFNGPLTFNDREGEYQLNQTYFFAERKTEIGGCGWDLGGRVDVLYGTDWRFAQEQGLESRWNSERFYGIAMPQLYMDVTYNNLNVRMGRFYTIIGYEVVMAPGNFFYSHAYTHQYGEPFSHTGLLAQYKLGDTLLVSGGFERGWDKWEDNNSRLEFIGGVTLTSRDECTSLAFAMTSGAWDNAGDLNRSMYSIVLTHKFTDRFQYVLEHDLGVDNDGGVLVRPGGRDDAKWFGVNQYFFYDINEKWRFGLRCEWFRDDDGTRVGGLGDPHGWTLGPNLPNQIGWAGDFYEITAGVNWKPGEHLTFRPECRWDWYNGPADGLGRLPYTFGQRRDQFTFAIDMILKY